MPIEPAQTLRDAYNAADPAVPLPSGDPRYVDCTDVRGNRDVVQRLFDTITWSDSNTAQLLTGHRGCGKSTELLRLKARLEKADYAVIYFEADEDLDVNDIIYSDLLLAIGRHIESELRQEYDIKLPPELLENVENWFAEVLYTEEEWKKVQRELAAEAKLGVGLPESVPLLARLMARVTGQIKTGHDVREEIRNKLDPQISALIENVNLLLLRANERLSRQDKQGLVLLIDNLDRVTLRELESGRTSHDALYIDHGEQLRSIRCHVVYTVPISMIYSPKATQLKAIFPNTWVVPMIKIVQKEGGDYHYNETLRLPTPLSHSRAGSHARDFGHQIRRRGSRLCFVAQKSLSGRNLVVVLCRGPGTPEDDAGPPHRPRHPFRR